MTACVLVTGGAGFIGSAVCLDLIAAGYRVANFDAMTYAAAPASLARLESNPDYQLIRGDIRDADALQAAFQRVRPDAVMHLAAESHVDRSITGAGVFIDTNIMGTFTLLQAVRTWRDTLKGDAADQFRMLHISTDEVFGSLGADGQFDEATAYDPSSPYSASKAASDHLVRAWGRTYGLNLGISNCSNNYGPRQFPEKLIPLMILNALAGKPLPVYGNGSNVRDWLHVEDHARALRQILFQGKAGATYCIGGDAERSNLHVVHAICDLVDARRPRAGSRRELIRFVEDRPGHDQRYAIDAAKIRSDLGWTPSVSFEEGLAATVDWYLGHPDWWQPILDGVYNQERLGLVT